MTDKAFKYLKKQIHVYIMLAPSYKKVFIKLVFFFIKLVFIKLVFFIKMLEKDAYAYFFLMLMPNN